MNRYLAPAPAQWDRGQMVQVAAVRFGKPVLDVNEVDNGDGTKSLAVYLDTAASGALVTAWRADVAAAVYTPDPTAGNAAALAAKIPAALTNNATYLAIASPSNAQVAAQVAALTRQIDALGRIVGGILDSTAGT